jgi:ferritin-like metal-binding protein YciE
VEVLGPSDAPFHSHERIVAMQIGSLKDMYIAELQELANVERQVAEAMPGLAEVASHPGLKIALRDHGEEAAMQMKRLESILQKHGANAKAHVDQAMQAMLKETRKMFAILKGNNLRDAGLIASAQKLKHYEIAAYGTSAAFAGQLEYREDQSALHESLEEEKNMDARLTKLAKGEVNRDALAA